MEIEQMAEENGIDLEKLDRGMRTAADEYPRSLERALLESNLSREHRLRVGMLVHLLVKYSACIEEVRRWVTPLWEKGRAGKGELHHCVQILVARTVTEPSRLATSNEGRNEDA